MISTHIFLYYSTSVFDNGRHRIATRTHSTFLLIDIFDNNLIFKFYINFRNVNYLYCLYFNRIIKGPNKKSDIIEINNNFFLIIFFPFIINF